MDGGSRGNPGPAAVAAVAADADGEALAERKRYIGEATNNIAEYARQIGGEYKVKHAGLKPLFTEAMTELRNFHKWSVRPVRREQNARADELVNEALDAALS